MADPKVLNGHTSVKDTRAKSGLEFRRFFTTGKVSPFDAVEWEKRTAQIGNEKGQVIFRQENVEVPKSWSMTATNIVASKYFHGKMNTQDRETSVRQLIGRVVETITRWGEQGGYFASAETRDIFRDELAHLLVEQKMAFNSPVWFNVGVQAKPQCSACFINSVRDDMQSIMDLAKTEGMLFKWGSGTGTNFSSLRAGHETLSGGGIASGPLSFMKGFDAFAGVIKSGGKTRRAAKMVILNIDHPDIVEFIDCKMKEEAKAHALIEAGYDPAIDGEAYTSIFYQNANHSVRVTDEFMQAVEEDRDWWTRNVTDGTPHKKYSARELLRRTAASAWHCGDPGMQYDTTVNRWHTCRNTDRIYASNPCSEYMFLDDTACNLASLNLMKFLGPSGQFDTEAFRQAVDITITAQEILVDNASYPTPKIAQNSHDYRPLGLGYANLGALLMSLALPYDSDEGRAMCAAVTGLMQGQAYAQSARIAERMGPFPGYEKNREPMLEVVRMHCDSLRPVKPENVPVPNLRDAAQEALAAAVEHGEKFGYKNSQVSVLAPTGTIGFMMDCDTTGIEPDLALVKYKRLVGGGLIKIVNNTVPQALMHLGYTPEETSAIVSYIDDNGTIEGAPGLKPEHLPVFDCSLTPANGSRSISWHGHLRMMAAAQPFLSGAISKTINMPEESTVEEVMQAYIEAWKLGLKAVAIYRDNSKKSQPLSSADGKEKKDVKAESRVEPAPASIGKSFTRTHLPRKSRISGIVTQKPDGSWELHILNKDVKRVLTGREEAMREFDEWVQFLSPHSCATEDCFSWKEVRVYGSQAVQQELFQNARRRKLPNERESITHKFSIGGHEGYITVGMYEDGTPGEIFVKMAKEGSTLSGIMDGFALSVSIALQYGVPLKALVDKFMHTRFEPSGFTGNPDIPIAKSVLDYIARWLGGKFISRDYFVSNGTLNGETPAPPALPPALAPAIKSAALAPDAMPAGPRPHAAIDDAPSCSECGMLMTRNGACYKCENCGSTSGCS